MNNEDRDGRKSIRLQCKSQTYFRVSQKFKNSSSAKSYLHLVKNAEVGGPGRTMLLREPFHTWSNGLSESARR